MADGTAFLVDAMLPRLLAPATLAKKPEIVTSVEAMIRRSSFQGVAAALRGMAERQDARPLLAQIDVPTLVIVGSEDAITPPAAAQAMAAQIRDAELAVINGAGHLAPYEQPEPVNTAIRKLLRRVSTR